MLLRPLSKDQEGNLSRSYHPEGETKLPPHPGISRVKAENRQYRQLPWAPACRETLQQVHALSAQLTVPCRRESSLSLWPCANMLNHFHHVLGIRCWIRTNSSFIVQTTLDPNSKRGKRLFPADVESR